MSKILALLMLVFILEGCFSGREVNKDELQERSENMDLIIDDLDTFIEEDEDSRNTHR